MIDDTGPVMLPQALKCVVRSSGLSQCLFEATQPGTGNNPTDATARPVSFIVQGEEFYSCRIQRIHRDSMQPNSAKRVAPGFESISMYFQIADQVAEMHYMLCQFERNSRIGI